MTAYNPETGSLLWRCQGTTGEVTPTPVVGFGKVYCSAGRAGPTLAIRPGGSGDVTKTHLEWKTAKGSPFVASTVLYDGLLYMVNDANGVISCVDAATGAVRWQGRLEGKSEAEFTASLMAVDGKIFITNEQGETFVVRAGPKFELLHINDLGERTLASPALASGRWYLRTDKHLYCVGQQQSE